MVLTRTRSMADRVLGTLETGSGVWLAHTLEDARRPVKVAGATCVPPGRYRVRVTKSARFNAYLPILEGVMGFTGIRIHGGNGPEDTEGCVLVGKRLDGCRVRDCAPAVRDVVAAVESEGASPGGCWMDIVDAFREGGEDGQA